MKDITVKDTQDPAYTLFLDDVTLILDALDITDDAGYMSPKMRILRGNMADWLNSVIAD